MTPTACEGETVVQPAWRRRRRRCIQTFGCLTEAALRLELHAHDCPAHDARTCPSCPEGERLSRRPSTPVSSLSA